MYLSVFLIDASDTDNKADAFQVLNVKPKQALVATYKDATAIRYGLRVTIQRFAVWRNSEIDGNTSEMLSDSHTMHHKGFNGTVRRINP